MPQRPTDEDQREPQQIRERSAFEDIRVLASLAQLKEELGDTAAGHEIARALTLELKHIESRLRDTVHTMLHAASDEARMQAHLGVLEIRDRLGALDPFFRMVRKPIGTAGHAKLQLALAGMELHDVVAERVRRARDELALFERATEQALEKLSGRIDALTLALRGSRLGQGMIVEQGEPPIVGSQK